MLTSISDIDILEKNNPMGEGAFSVVVKCRLKADGKLYALKIVALIDRYVKAFQA